MTGSRSRDYSAGQAVLDSLKAGELSLRKAKVERVTVVKFRVDERGGNSFSSGEVEERAYTTKTTDVVEARFREGRNLIREGKVMVKDEAKITCGMRRVDNSLRREIKNRTVKFRELLRKAKKKEFSFGRVESEEIRRIADIQSDILF